MSRFAVNMPGPAAVAAPLYASGAASSVGAMSPNFAIEAERPSLLARGRKVAWQVAGAFNDYSVGRLGIDLRALNPKSYAGVDASDAVVAGGMAMAEADGAAHEDDVIDEATSVRSDPPPPPENSSLLKKILTYYINTPAISVPTIEMTVFALFASALHYAVSQVAATNDPTIEPEFVVHSADKVAKLGLSFLGLATLYFGENAFPEFMRPVVRPVLGLAKYFGRPLRWLGGKLPGDALSFAGEMLENPRMREKGFILGVAQEIRERYDRTVLDHPYMGRYTTGDLRIWGAELLINGLIVFPLVALSLDIPFWETVAPSVGISFAATLASARMSKLWGAAERYMGRIVLGRTAIFAFANTVAPLAAILLKTGTMSAGSGYLIQLGLTFAMSLGALGLIRPPKDTG